MKSEQRGHSPKNTIAMSVWLLWAPEQSVSSWNPTLAVFCMGMTSTSICWPEGPGVEATLGL